MALQAKGNCKGTLRASKLNGLVTATWTKPCSRQRRSNPMAAAVYHGYGVGQHAYHAVPILCRSLLAARQADRHRGSVPHAKHTAEYGAG